MTDRPKLEADFLGTPTATPTLTSPAPRDVADALKIRTVTVYLPVQLHATVTDTARRRGITLTALTEEAFTDHGSNFRELVPTRPGAMPTRVPQRRRGVGGTIQMQLRLNGEQLQWLDEQVTRHGAPSRSALVTAVLDKHLSGATR